MNAAARLAAVGAALAVLTGGAFAVGAAVGPAAAPAPVAAEPAPGSAHGDDHAAPPSTGLASSTDGFTFTPAQPVLTVGEPNDFRFRILGPDGVPVTAFDEEHTQRMHLILVRRDTTGFQHLHPELDPDGTWRVPLTLPAAGSYRAFADFRPTGGPPLTLGVDLAAPGDQTPVRHDPARTAQPDGYQVRLDGELVPGQLSPLTLTVTRDGAPVTDLQPYLGAYGHLVALREGDLAYLHVHPDGNQGDGRTPAGPQIRFLAEVPSAAAYRLFLDFRHGDTVRTAEFTVPAGDPGHPHAAEERLPDGTTPDGPTERSEGVR